MNLLTELKRRNVIRMAGLYLVGAWLITQVSATLLPTFDAPQWVLRAIVMLLAIGFVPALIFSWVFELTPEGLKRDAEVKPEESIAPQTARRMDRMIIVVLIIAVVYFAADKFALAPRREAALREPAAQATTPANPGSTAAVAQDINPKSIAVLPFANLSEEKANAFFADGIQDEILTRLAKIGTLKVISRTSTLRYATHPDDLKEIARQLGVANILEGSVQKAADAVRVNVQLIRAEGDSHLWAETYDRKLDNVFGVESEVATAIAAALDAKLSGTEKAELARKPTTNAEAWEVYLHGLVLSDRPDLEATDQIAAGKAFEEAVRLDPGFVNAWAMLSIVDAGLVFTEVDSSTARRDGARGALAQAVRLSPDAYETRRAQAYNAYFIERDYDGSRAILEQIRSRAPSDAEIPRALALIARRQGRWDESDRLFNEALDLDPRNLKVLMWAADNQLAHRQFPAALRLLARFTDIAPSDIGALARESNIHIAMGDLDSAEADVARMHGDGNSMAQQQSIYLLLLRHRFAEGATLMRKILAETDPADLSDHGSASYWLGEFLRLSGDAAGAKAFYIASREDAQRLCDQQPNSATMISALAMVDAALGNREAALSNARKAIAVLPASKDALTGVYYEEVLVRIQSRFDDKDAAIAGLQHLLATPFGFFFTVPLTPATLRLDPGFDNLHDDPRFRKLAEMPDAPPQAGGKP